MAHLLKQSTAYTFRLGPFLDSTDGNTQENALTIAAADVLLSKAGGALAAKNEATALTGTGANAHYTCIINTTDTNTLGTFRVWSHITGALAVWQDFMVLPANIYDSMVSGSDLIDVNTTQWAGAATAADDVALVTMPANFAALSITAGGLVDITQAAADKVWSSATRTLTAFSTALALSVWDVLETAIVTASSIGVKVKTNLDATVSSRSSHAAADIWAVGTRTLTSFGTLIADTWSYATRVLTAGTNIALAKGTGVTGFNDLSAAQVNTEVDTAIVDVRLDELLAADSDIDGVTPPTVGSVFHELMTKTAGSFTYDQTTDSLEALRDRGDAAWITATGFSTHTAANVWAVATRALTDKVDFALSTASRAAIVDEVWDEDVDTTHQTAGTAGKKLDDAGGAADPWGTAIPGAYGSGTAGNILGNRLVGTIATGTHNPQSGDGYAIVNNVTYGNSAIETLVDDLETRCTEVRLAELDAANLPTDVAQVKTDTAATLLDTGTDGVVIKLINQDYLETGTAQAGSVNSITLAAGAGSTTDLWVGQHISIYDGTGAGQTRGVQSYNGTTKVLVVARNWKVNPDATSKYKIQLLFGPKVNNNLEVKVENAGGDLTAIPWNAAWDAEVQSECADALVAYDGIVPADLPANFAVMSISATTGLVDITQAAADKVWSSATRTLTSFGTLIADTWGYATRILTAGTNIALAKGTGVTGFNDIAAADVWAVATRALTDKAGFSLTQAFPTNFALLSIDGSGYVTEVNVDGIKKNTALNNFEFPMVDATDGYTEETGLTVTATRSIDGAAFGACANAVTEVSNGIYKINLAAADLNGDVITLRFSASGARSRLITLKTNT